MLVWSVHVRHARCVEARTLHSSTRRATWDQRGTGGSVSALEPLRTHTVEQAVADTIEVTEYLLDRFDESGVYLVGSSWGTTLGMLEAPSEQLVVFESSGHTPHLDEPGRFARLMADVVLAEQG